MSDALADARHAMNRLMRIAGLARRRACCCCWRPRRRWPRWSAIPPTMPASTMPICATPPTGWARSAPWRPICCCRSSAWRRWRSWRRCLSGARAPCAAQSVKYAMWRLVAWPLGTTHGGGRPGPAAAADQPAGRRRRPDRHCGGRPFRPCRARCGTRPGWPGRCLWACCLWACRWLSWPPACASCRSRAASCAISGGRALAGRPGQEAAIFGHAAGRRSRMTKTMTNTHITMDEDGYHLDDARRAAEPIAAARLAERHEKPGQARRCRSRSTAASAPTSRPALNLSSGEYQLARAGPADRAAAGQGHPHSVRRGAGRKCPHAGSGADRFRRQGPHHRRAPRPGGDACMNSSRRPA